MSNNQNNINQGQNNFQENTVATKKKPFYKKVWFIILAVIVAIIVLGGIFSSGDSSTDSDNNSASQSENKADTIQKNEAKLGDYEVVIEKCELIDYDGKDVAVVTFAFTNNSSQAASFDLALQAKAFQDGIEAERNYVYDVFSDEYDEDGNQHKEIKPGNSINVRIAYTLNSTEKPLEVEVSELCSFNSSVIEKTFNF